MEQGINTVFDAHEAAGYIKVHYETILRMVRRKELPSFKAGRKLLFRKETLDKWMQEQEQRSTMEDEEQGKVTFLHKAII